MERVKRFINGERWLYAVHPIEYTHGFVVVLFWLVNSCDLYTHILQYYSDVIMSTMVSQITSLMIVYSIVYSGADQRNIKASRWPVNFPHKWPVTRKMFPFDDVIMGLLHWQWGNDCPNASKVTLKDMGILGQSYDSPSVSEAILKDMGKIGT